MRTVLGLDIGSKSVGWAIIREEEDDAAQCEIVAAGVRCFEAGVDGFGTSKEATPASKRGAKRRMRRQAVRRTARLRHLYGLLAELGCWPQSPGKSEQAIGLRSQTLDSIDAAVREACCPPGDHVAQQVVHYRLRQLALDRRLELPWLGRALYHLGQRRGFLSNRKAERKGPKDKEDVGPVKEGIRGLREAMLSSRARTLGEYFAGMDPTQSRIRQRWTAREMYLHEFECIRKAQASLGCPWSEHDWNRVRWALFDQRPLSSAKHLVGYCTLETGKRRAPLRTDLAQIFRVLQTVNNLRFTRNGHQYEPLPTEWRSAILAAMMRSADVSFAAVRKLIGKEAKGARFNLEEEGDKKLPGHRVNAKMLAILGEKWNTLSGDAKDRLVHRLHDLESPESGMHFLRSEYGCSQEEAEQLVSTSFEDGYLSISRKAILRIMPLLEQGLTFGEARRVAYPEQFTPTRTLEKLPPALETLKDLKNPLVARSLTEVRRVVNALLKEHGRPDLIRIEVARDLKNSRSAREIIAKRVRDRTTVRLRAAEEYMARYPGSVPTGRDIDKLLLAQECRWKCPYTGRAIGWESLFGPEPQFDVEHIIPYSRSFDNSLANKTLCEVNENRTYKRNQTPFEAYSREPARFDEILDRVSNFQADRELVRRKLERFLADDVDGEEGDGFLARHLNDTRWASRLSCDYLGVLYGGRVDAEGRQRIQVSTGTVTAQLRRAWGLEGLLGGGEGKNRADHRHHAIDALVVALCGPRWVQRFARAASQAERQGLRRLFQEIEPPSAEFRQRVADLLEGLIVSHRVHRSVRGELHEESNYRLGVAPEAPTIRKPLDSIGDAQLSQVHDPLVRSALERWGADGRPAGGPLLGREGGRAHKLRRARVKSKRTSLAPIGRGAATRYVAPGANHHIEFFENSETGAFMTRLVTRLEANRRVTAGQPVIDKSGDPGYKYLFALHPGDCVGRLANGVWHVIRISGISEGLVEGLPHTDARSSKEVRAGGAALGRFMVAPASLLKQGFSKVEVSPIGALHVSRE